jgi:hypothetical protein
MKQIIISADCSMYKDKDIILRIIKNDIIPLIKYHFKVISVNIEDSFIRTVIDVDGVEPEKMSYLNIVNYCRDLYQTILYNYKYDISVSCYT